MRAMPGYEGQVLGVIPLHKMCSEETQLPFPYRRCTNLGIGAVSLEEFGEDSEVTHLPRYLRQLEEQFSQRHDTVHDREAPRHSLLDASPGVGDSDIDISPSNPSNFLLDSQASIGWRGIPRGKWTLATLPMPYRLSC